MYCLDTVNQSRGIVCRLERVCTTRCMGYNASHPWSSWHQRLSRITSASCSFSNPSTTLAEAQRLSGKPEMPQCCEAYWYMLTTNYSLHEKEIKKDLYWQTSVVNPKPQIHGTAPSISPLDLASWPAGRAVSECSFARGRVFHPKLERHINMTNCI